jgi:mono/diheme cytochrome c family protein
MVAVEHQYKERTSRGMARFVFDDLGDLNTDTLRTHAVPWKVVIAALMLEQAGGQGTLSRAGVTRELERFGFIFPATIENWDTEMPPQSFDKPLGIVSGLVTRPFPRVEVELANLSCAACHAGVLYDRDGLPQRRVWLGLPNTSINFEAYSQAAYRALKEARRSKGALLGAIRQLFPEVSAIEMRTIERYVLPSLDRRLMELEGGTDTPAPFNNGGPGLTNGIGSLKRQLRLLAVETFSDEVPFVSIPDLGGVLLRSSFLADGAYAPPGHPRFARVTTEDLEPERTSRAARVIGFFTVPAMGMEPRAALRAMPQVEDILAFLETYHSPRFPGDIDRASARQGQDIYSRKCASCHGAYSENADRPALIAFPNRLVPAEEIGTDPARARAMTPDLTRAVSASAFGKNIVAAATGGYVAPRLGGLWATAPYLHNGSVPTLWHLLHPATRPTRFLVGGHRLDFSMMGIAGYVDGTGTYRYPDGYQSWSSPALYDTTQPGRSNRGHEAEFDALTEAEKAAVLEFLKLL